MNVWISRLRSSSESTSCARCRSTGVPIGAILRMVIGGGSCLDDLGLEGRLAVLDVDRELYVLDVGLLLADVVGVLLQLLHELVVGELVDGLAALRLHPQEFLVDAAVVGVLRIGG